MKKGMLFFVTFSLLAMTAMTGASSSNIRVQPGPVEVKQGHTVSLWCEVKQDTESVIPVHWQSPPNYRTRTTNCVSFLTQKYDILCGETHNNIMWFNVTITDVQWTDKGSYRCIYTSCMGIVVLKVLVPVRDVSLTSTSKSLVLRKGIDAMFTCTTDCAYPAPTISWFQNGQPFKDSAVGTTITESGCSGEKQGQKRTISSITVRDEKERKDLIISCKAGNIFGEKNISKTIVVTYDGPCKNVWCPPGRVCLATSKNPGVCVCGPPDLCNDHHTEQVCGDDGILYSSLCDLHRTACVEDKHIGVDHTNTCKPKVTPSPPQITKGGIAAAVVVPVLVVAAIIIIIIVYRRRVSCFRWV